MKSLTIVFITSRHEPRYDWLADSLLNQNIPPDGVKVICVDFYAGTRKNLPPWLNVAPPKPTIWQGEHCILKEDWWGISNARNTGLCLADTEWIACLDDRMVLAPTWLEAIRDAMNGNYVVCGPYEKRSGMMVDNGRIRQLGELTGMDSRFMGQKDATKCRGQWMFGCNFALPLEWVLEMNGIPEDYCDGIGMEDVLTGIILENRGREIRYDPRMKMVEDRTREFLGKTFRREDKGVSPNDKSHKILEVFKDAKDSKNSFDIRKMRQNVLSGKPFPNPTASHFDWYDGQAIKDFR